MQSEIINNVQAIIIEDDLPALMIHDRSEQGDHGQVEAHIFRVLKYIKEQAPTIRMLIAHDNGQAFRGKLIAMISVALNTTHLENHIHDIPKNYVAAAFSGLSSSIIFEWIESDFALSEREICRRGFILMFPALINPIFKMHRAGAFFLQIIHCIIIIHQTHGCVADTGAARQRLLCQLVVMGLLIPYKKYSAKAVDKGCILRYNTYETTK